MSSIKFFLKMHAQKLISIQKQISNLESIQNVNHWLIHGFWLQLHI